jgi:hypothetical protein
VTTEQNIERDLLAPRKLIIQFLGFLLGAALLAWCIRSAMRQGGWERLADASPGLIALMVACSFVSVLANGLTFWVTIRPLRAIRLWDLQCLNVLASMLNYAPVRLGAILRVVYHVRLDRLTLFQVGAWFSFIGYLTVLGGGACLIATLARPTVDIVWVAFVLGQMIVGGLLLHLVAGNPLLVQYGPSIEAMIGSRPAVWGGLGIRVIDLAAFIGRMACAAAVLQIPLSSGQVAVLAVVALAAGLIPFGRLGFREFCVAAVAHRLAMMESDVTQNMEQLALVESAAEAIVFVPLGTLAGVFWLRRRWRRGPDPDAQQTRDRATTAP